MLKRLSTIATMCAQTGASRHSSTYRGSRTNSKLYEKIAHKHSHGTASLRGYKPLPRSEGAFAQRLGISVAPSPPVSRCLLPLLRYLASSTCLLMKNMIVKRRVYMRAYSTSMKLVVKPLCRAAAACRAGKTVPRNSDCSKTARSNGSSVVKLPVALHCSEVMLMQARRQYDRENKHHHTSDLIAIYLKYFRS